MYFLELGILSCTRLPFLWSLGCRYSVKLYNTSADVFIRDFLVYADTISQTWTASYNPSKLTISYTSADVLSGAWGLVIYADTIFQAWINSYTTLT